MVYTGGTIIGSRYHMNDEFNDRQEDQLTFDAKKAMEELLGYLIESDTLIIFHRSILMPTT